MDDIKNDINKLQNNIKDFVINSLNKDTSVVKYVEFDKEGNVTLISINIVNK